MKENETHTFEDIFMKLSFPYAKRFTYGQKKRALMYIADIASEAGQKAEMVFWKIGMAKVNSLVIGNLDKAEKVLMTPLDTPHRFYTKKYVYCPFDDEVNYRNEKKNMAVIILTKVILLACAFLFIHVLPLSGLPYFNEVLYTAVMFMAASYIHDALLPSFPNFNKSTASLALLVYLSQKKQKDTAFVLLDRCAEGTAGLKMFLLRCRDRLKNKKILYTDCIADGRDLLFGRMNGDKNKGSETMKTISFSEEKMPNVFTEAGFRLNTLFSGTWENNELQVFNTRSRNDSKLNKIRLLEIGEWMMNEY